MTLRYDDREEADREPRRPQTRPRMASYKKETAKPGSEQFRLREEEERQAQGQAQRGQGQERWRIQLSLEGKNLMWG